MGDTTKQYNAVPGYFELTPRELTAPGSFMEYSPRQTALVRAALCLAFSDIIIAPEDVERYQSAGPAVVVPPHRSLLDLPVVSHLGELSGEGQPYFLSKRENMNNRLSARFFSRMRTFPMDRDMDDPRFATKFVQWSRFVLGDNVEMGEQAMKLVIFGDGTRKKGPKIETMFPGPLFAAKKNKRLVLPIGIGGTDQLRLRDFRPTVAVTVGEPYEVKSLRDVDVLTEKVQEQYDRANAIVYKYTA